jgi:hypothetical protein
LEYWVALFFLLLLFLGEPVASATAMKPISLSSISLREKLLQVYGIRAVDQTDDHAPIVLRNFLFLLQHAFSPEFVHGLKNVQFLYAYAGHDRTYDLGAFHEEAKAISIAGRLSFPDDEENSPDPRIIATLAHELGHAFLLQEVSPEELRSISEKFGGWAKVFGNEPPRDLYSKAFFSPHPSFPGVNITPAEAGEWKKSNFCSRLSAKNIHEWFADAFAAVALQRLGNKGWLGDKWRDRIILSPRNRKEYWSNYNWVTAEFSAWLQKKIKSLQGLSP